jgi:hypothetical protein
LPIFPLGEEAKSRHIQSFSGQILQSTFGSQELDFMREKEMCGLERPRVWLTQHRFYTINYNIENPKDDYRADPSS